MDTTLSSWIDQIHTAAAQHQTLRIQGGGSKAFYGEPVAGAQWLDTRVHAGIVCHEPSELVVTVRCGTPLTELEAALDAHGQCLAFEPPHFRAMGADSPSLATVGGMLACGLAGPARASVGGVRDHVLGVQMINGKGECLIFGGQVMKNVAGYDVSRVLAASMGTLGVITEVSLKVLPHAPAEATLACPLPQAQALALVNRWGGQPLPLNASCWVHDTSTQPSQEILFVRLRGAVAAVDAAVQRMHADVAALGASAMRVEPAQARADWAACRDQTLPFFTPPAPEMGLWRLSVAPTAPVLDLPNAPLIEWHGGVRWVWAPVSAAPGLRAMALQAGGHATLFRAPARPAGEMPARFSPLPAVQQRIQRELQQQFDPHGVFNTGRAGLL
ncbi:MAG: glycolate oxidase subunit GlcE [Betaproteobacteria bacterium]|nr:glycolate oxidase subunit GlcE [Betaproteobacteria bacterium]